MAHRIPRPDNAQKPRYYDGTKRDRQRPYDPKVDGWNVHKRRYEPTAYELIAQQQLRDNSVF